MKKAEAISILATSARPREAKDRARYDEAVRMAIEALKCSEIPNSSDSISRQAGIDALARMMPRSYTPDGSHPADEEIFRAQEVIADCIEALEILSPAQPETHWISCSERLPEHGGRYLVSVLDGINRRTTVAPYMPRCKAWTMTGRMTYWKVIAWMPLPASYKGE